MINCCIDDWGRWRSWRLEYRRDDSAPGVPDPLDLVMDSCTEGRDSTQTDLGKDAVNRQAALTLWSLAPAKENSLTGTGECHGVVIFACSQCKICDLHRLE